MIGATYYVDYSSGFDGNNGTSTGTAWKHCPGDVNASSVAAAASLSAGDTVTFKGGVSYVLNAGGGATCIGMNWSGTAASPITYDGNSTGTWGTGKAIITDNFSNHGGQVWFPFYGGGNRTGLTLRNLQFQNIGGSAALPADTGSPIARNSAVCIFVNGSANNVIVRDCSFSQIGYWFHQKPMNAEAISGGGVTVLNCNSLTITNCSFTRMNIGCEMAANSSINNLTIANCTFTDSMRWPIDLLPNASGAVIDNVFIHHNQFYDHWQFELDNWTGYGDSPHNDSIFMRIDTATCSWGSNVNIYANQFWSTEPNKVGGTASIYITGGPSANIYNNTFRGTAQSRTIFVNGGTPGPTPQVVRIYNNSFLVSYELAIELSRNVVLLGTVDIRNNIFYDVRTGSSNNEILRISNATIANSLTVDYNRYYSFNTGGGWFFWSTLCSGGLSCMQSRGLEVNGSFGDPQFVNVVGVGANVLQNDLRLQAASPVRDIGVPLGATYATDFLGVVRPQGAGWDPGAYEFSSGAPPPVPGVPMLTSPADGAAGVLTTTSLLWGAVNGATSYRVQLSLDSAFTQVLLDSTTASASVTTPVMANSTTHYWRVLATNGSGSSSFSGARRFTTVAAVPQSPQPPTGLSAVLGTVGSSVPVLFTWTSNTDPFTVGYQLYVAPAATLVPVLVATVNGVGGTNTTYSVSSGVYVAYLKAFSSNGTASSPGGLITVVTSVGPDAVVVATAQVFQTQPSDVVQNVAISPAVQVKVVNAGGTTITGFTGPITVAVASNPGGSSLGGTRTVNAVAGVATFSTLALNNVASGYTLKATTVGLPNATSVSFNVAAVTYSLTVNSGSGDGVYQAGTVVSIVADLPASGFQFSSWTGATVASPSASSTTLTMPTSATVVTANYSAIPPLPATKVVFTVQPVTTQAGAVMLSIIVQLQNATNGVVLGSSNSVSLAIGTNPSGGALSGTNPRSAVAGVATFPDLSIDKAGNNYTLLASSSGLTGSTSNEFNISSVPTPPVSKAVVARRHRWWWLF